MSIPTNQVTRILLFDDDAMYCKVMEKTGEKLKIEVITCTDIDEFCLVAMGEDFDVALIDYNLEAFKGSNVAKVVEAKPTYLISNNSKIANDQSQWGPDVHGFFAKESGPESILTAASASAVAATKRKAA